jgi:glycine/D-amino acid oxidase-like deaminating enzyme
MADGQSGSDRGGAPQMRENSIPPTSDVPVMIVGAGPVGLTLAVGLAKQGIRSVVLEKKPELGEHSRALAVQATMFRKRLEHPKRQHWQWTNPC